MEGKRSYRSQARCAPFPSPVGREDLLRRVGPTRRAAAHPRAPRGSGRRGEWGRTGGGAAVPLPAARDGGSTGSRLVCPARPPARCFQPAASRLRGALAGGGTARGGRWGTGSETRPAAALEVRGDARGAMEAGPL